MEKIKTITDFEGLKEWLPKQMPKQKSKYGKDCEIEGIVWYCENGDMYKMEICT